jgi:hypothetical protein
MAKKKEILKKKVYTVEVIEYTDGSVDMNRTNDGFHAMDLLAHLEFIKSEVVDQIKGVIKPTKITRKVIKDE